MKKVIAVILLFVVCFLFVFNTTSFASSIEIKEYFSGQGKQIDFEETTNGIYGLLFNIGVIVAVCVLMTISISYLVATPNKKAILKERLVYYLAGVIFLVGCLSFLKIYEGIANDIGNMVETGNGTSGSQNSTSGSQISNSDKSLLDNDFKLY